jgi:NAD(P)-dependent dehydrogenase (short-subunit alcohol dehydrogenase family)
MATPLVWVARLISWWMLTWIGVALLGDATHNIAVFALGPGLVPTAMTDHAFAPQWQKWDDVIPRLFAKGRGSPPEDAARLNVALARPTRFRAVISAFTTIWRR